MSPALESPSSSRCPPCCCCRRRGLRFFFVGLSPLAPWPSPKRYLLYELRHLRMATSSMRASIGGPSGAVASLRRRVLAATTS